MAPFLERLSETGNVVKAARFAKVARSYLYRTRLGNEAFAHTWDEALRCAVAVAVEPEAFRRAISGVLEPVYYQGKTDNQRMGIGKTTPGVELDVEGAIYATSGAQVAGLRGNWAGAPATGSFSANPFLLIENASEVARLTGGALWARNTFKLGQSALVLSEVAGDWVFAAPAAFNAGLYIEEEAGIPSSTLAGKVRLSAFPPSSELWGYSDAQGAMGFTWLANGKQVGDSNVVISKDGASGNELVTTGVRITPTGIEEVIALTMTGTLTLDSANAGVHQKARTADFVAATGYGTTYWKDATLWARWQSETPVDILAGLAGAGNVGTGDALAAGYLAKGAGGSDVAVSTLPVVETATGLGIGMTSPGATLGLGSTLGDKLAVYDNGAGVRYGLGVQANLLQVITPTQAADLAWGYGTSSAFMRRMTLDMGTGRLGIGTASPTDSLHVGGTARITSDVTMEAALWLAGDLTLGTDFIASTIASNFLNLYRGVELRFDSENSANHKLYADSAGLSIEFGGYQTLLLGDENNPFLECWGSGHATTANRGDMYFNHLGTRKVVFKSDRLRLNDGVGLHLGSGNDVKLKVELGKHRVELASGVDYLLTIGGSEVFDIQDGGDPKFKRGGTERLALTGAGGTLTGVWNATAGLQVGGVDVALQGSIDADMLDGLDSLAFARLSNTADITAWWRFMDDNQLRLGTSNDAVLGYHPCARFLPYRHQKRGGLLNPNGADSGHASLQDRRYIGRCRDRSRSRRWRQSNPGAARRPRPGQLLAQRQRRLRQRPRRGPARRRTGLALRPARPGRDRLGPALELYEWPRHRLRPPDRHRRREGLSLRGALERRRVLLPGPQQRRRGRLSGSPDALRGIRRQPFCGAGLDDDRAGEGRDELSGLSQLRSVDRHGLKRAGLSGAPARLLLRSPSGSNSNLTLLTHTHNRHGKQDEHRDDTDTDGFTSDSRAAGSGGAGQRTAGHVRGARARSAGARALRGRADPPAQRLGALPGRARCLPQGRLGASDAAGGDQPCPGPRRSGSRARPAGRQERIALDAADSGGSKAAAPDARQNGAPRAHDVPTAEATLSLSLSITQRLVCLQFVPRTATRRKAQELQGLIDTLSLSREEQAACLGGRGEILVDEVKAITLPRRMAFQLRKGVDGLDATGRWPTPAQRDLYAAYEATYRAVAEALDAPATARGEA